MKILALEHEVPGTLPEQFAPHLDAETRRVWELVQAGTIREMYFRQDRTQAVIVLECDDADAARAVLETLPLVRAGLITFEVIPLRAYPGFRRLFRED
ncbi:MAG: superoxide dismutase [Anaerolineae bacterium]|nr:superoxide dismutase [Anaerolineae bacterium]